MPTGRPCEGLYVDATDIGVRNLMLKLNTGEMPTERGQASIKLFREKVLLLLGNGYVGVSR